MTNYVVDTFPFPESKVLGVDIETTRRFGKDSDPLRDDIISIQLSDGKDGWLVNNPRGFGSINPILEAPGVTKIIHNANFDLQFLIHKLGAKPNKHSLWDSLLAERVLNAGEDISNGLDAVAARRLGLMLDKTIRDTFREQGDELTKDQINYALDDVLCLPSIYSQQVEDVKHNLVGRVVGLENRILGAVARMSLSGVRYDDALWQTYVPQIREMLSTIEHRVGERAGLAEQFTLFGDSNIVINLASSDQVVELLASKGIKLEKRGKPTTDKTVIADFLADHPDHPYYQMLEDIREWRQWNHTLSTSYAKYINPATGLIHCSWNQIKADSGRFSASDPNLQNVERPSKNKPNLRHLFLPPEGYDLVDVDSMQQEPRIFAQISGDELMRQACQSTDVYEAFRQVIPSHPARQQVKTGLLTRLYGGQEATVANRMQCSLEEARNFCNDIDRQFGTARRYASRARDAAVHSGMTRTILGRIRHYPEAKNKTITNHVLNEMTNTPIQGSGADMLKLAIDKMDDVIQSHGYDAWLSIVVHDEMVVTCRKDISQEVYYQALGCMEEAGRELCPDVLMPAEGGILERWDKS